MQIPLYRDAESTLSLQVQIFEQIRQMILDGRLLPNARMPASRALAYDLDVSRNTIVSVYDRLIAEGYLESRQPVGTFVATGFVQDRPAPASALSAAPSRVSARRRARLRFEGHAHAIVPPQASLARCDFWVGRPDADLFPIKDWMQIMRRKLRDMQRGNSAYVDPQGLLVLRRAIVQHVGMARGIRADPADVIVVNGTQEALTLLAQLFVCKGTRVAVENPCYQGAANVFACHGATLAPIQIDEQGMVVDHLPDDAAVVYVTPSHQYPTGVTLAPQRRAQLMDWAEKNDAYILEDDYNSDFCYDHAPLPALKSHETAEQVIYVGTFSKSLGAGLRVGYMIVPPHLSEIARTAKGLLNNCSGWAVQALLADFIASGQFQHHLRRVRTIYAARRNCLLEALDEFAPGGRVLGGQGGMHVVWEPPEGWPPATSTERLARDAGVGVYGLDACNAHVSGVAAQAKYASALMLGYAALDAATIKDGIRRLSAAVA